MIPKPFRKRSEKGGLPPGTLVHMRDEPRRLGWRSGYLMALLIMLIIGVGMAIYVKKRRCL